MIVETMSKAELYTELAADEYWLSERIIGLTIKYNKQLRNKHIPHGAVLGRTWYNTPNKNRVYCILQKYVVGEKGKHAIVSMVSLYEYTDQKGIKRYLYVVLEINSPRIKYVIMFSAHSISRMKERIGKDMLGVFEDICTKNDTCISLCKYDYNGADDEYAFSIGDNIAFAKPCDWGYVVATIITKEQEHTNQLIMHTEIKKHYLELSKEIADWHDDFYKANKDFMRVVARKSA